MKIFQKSTALAVLCLILFGSLSVFASTDPTDGSTKSSETSKPTMDCVFHFFAYLEADGALKFNRYTDREKCLADYEKIKAAQAEGSILSYSNRLSFSIINYEYRCFAVCAYLSGGSLRLLENRGDNVQKCKEYLEEIEGDSELFQFIDIQCTDCK